MAKQIKATKAELAAQLVLAVQALYAEPGAYTSTEPVRVTVTIHA